MQPLLLSSKGRLLYREEGFTARFAQGLITVEEDAVFVEAGNSLKSAYLCASEHFFAKQPIEIAFSLMEKPIYNTWMYAPFDVTQEKVISYAQTILKEGLPAGTIVIDDMWNPAYGDWQFDSEKFPDPIRMISMLHEMDFAVMLWVCPYVSFGTKIYESCLEKGLLLMSGDEAYHLEWWNETSACLDLRKIKTMEYLSTTLRKLQNMGVDGFKFDGGDSRYYLPEQEPDFQSRAWAEFAGTFRYNEIRAEFHGAGSSIFERLADKRHSWKSDGIAAILPASLALGLSGHPFFSPDMIGGGEVNDIREGCKLKKDIFLAHCQLAAFFPGIQFSILPEVVLGRDLCILHSLMRQRERYMPYLKELIKEASVTKEPMVRLMEYEFPGEDFEQVKNQFMLGNRYLVMPVTEKHQDTLKVKLPKGSWKCGETVYEGEREVPFPAKWDEVLVLEKIS